MILSQTFIRLFRAVRLITIEPYVPKQLGPNSYDVVLGNWFSNVTWKHAKPHFTKPFWRNDGDMVQVQSTVLGMTKEVIGGSYCIVCQMHARSTTRRMGITVCDDAGFGDIGYVNHWTLELGAKADGAVFVQPGQRIAQVEFCLTTPELANQYRGQYKQKEVQWPLCMIPKEYRPSEPGPYPSGFDRTTNTWKK